MYIKIDNLKFYGASPYFRIGNNLKSEVPITNHEERLKVFSEKLTSFISRKVKLSKPAQRVLQILIQKNVFNKDLKQAIEIDTYQLIEDLGYKNVASVYRAIGVLCSKDILSMSEKQGRKGTIMVYANPMIFGRDKVVVGEKVKLIL